MIFAVFFRAIMSALQPESTVMASKFQEWAAAVKARDGKCMECGRTEDLHAHHIKPKSSYPELSLDVDNGKTLCYRCHKIEHEKNRPVRIRSNKPQRRKLKQRIAELEQLLKMKNEVIARLQKSSNRTDFVSVFEGTFCSWKPKENRQ